ncbi:MAG: hypothetical protein ABIP74_01710 [Candidatus Saccharimonas sp.]
MTEQKTSVDHQYPHQGHLEPVAPQDLADDVSQHPEAYHPDLVANHISPFLAKKGIDVSFYEEHEQLAWEVVNKLNNWEEGSPPMTDLEAYLLIDVGFYGVIAANLDKFIGLNQYIAETLIEDGHGLTVVRHLDSFGDLSEGLALKLIENAYAHEVLPRLARFSGCTPSRMLELLLGARKASIIGDNLDLFVGISHNDIAHLLLSHDHPVLAAYIDKFKNLDASIAYQLIDLRMSHAVMGHFDQYVGLDRNEVARHLMYTDKVHLIVRYMNEFEDLDNDVANYLMGEAHGSVVLGNLERFKPINHQVLADQLVDTNHTHPLVEYIGKLSNIDFNEIALRMIQKPMGGYDLIQNLDKFPGLDYQQVFDALCAEGYQSSLVMNFNKFRGIDQHETVRKFIASGHGWIIARNLNYFPEVNHRETAQQMIDAGYGHAVLTGYEMFHDLGDETDILSQILRQEVTNITLMSPALLDRVRKNEAMVATLKDGLAQLYTKSELQPYEGVAEDAYARITGVLKPGADEIVDLNDNVFGRIGGVMTARMVYEMLHSDLIPSYAQEIGVTEVGMAGVEQLKATIAPVIAEFNTGNLSTDTERKIIQSEVLIRVLMGYTGYTDSNWGGNDIASLEDKLQHHVHAIDDGLISTEMHPAYEMSKTYDIKTASSRDVMELSEDVVARYGALSEDIRSAAFALEKPRGFSEIIRSLQREIDAIIDGLHMDLDTIDESDERAQFKRRNLEMRIEALESYTAQSRDGNGQRFVMNSPADFERGIVELAKYPELHSGIRTLTFAWAMRKNPNAMHGLRNVPEDASIDSISAVREFIEHIVNQETYGDYFVDKRSSNLFRKITSTRALEEAMIRHNKQSTRGGNTTGIQFVPTKGILMEMSGQIANACWADKDELIAEKRPNFTALIIRARPGKASERLVGAALLIETKDPNTGEEVLLLRGTNPTETYIKDVSVGDFYESIVDYVCETAKRRGMKPAIVIDDHSGGSGTNRPVLHGYLMAKMNDLKRQPVDDATTNFNGYNVTQDSFAL